jgi:hypothetical protein
VLALYTVGLVFKPSTGATNYQISTIDSTDGACNAFYQTPTGQPPGDSAWCNVTASSGKTVTITPHWTLKK